MNATHKSSLNSDIQTGAHIHPSEPGHPAAASGVRRLRMLRQFGVWALALVLLFGAVFTPLVFAQSEEAENGEAATSETQDNALSEPVASELVTEPGVLIVAVQPGSPAAQAGIVRGDILLTFNDLEVADALALVAAITDSEPAGDIELSWLHGSETRTATLTLADQDGVAFLGVQPYLELEQEVRLRLGRTLSPDVARDEMARGLFHVYRHDAARLGDIQGLVIVEVADESPAALAGLAPRDVIVSLNGEPMTTADELQAAIRSLQPETTVSLEIIRAQAWTAWIEDTDTENADAENTDAEIDTETLTVVLGELPEDAAVPFLGVRVLPMPGMLEYGMHQPGMMNRGMMGRGMMNPEMHSEMHSQMQERHQLFMDEKDEGMAAGPRSHMRGMMQGRMGDERTPDGEMRGRFFMEDNSHMGRNLMQWGMRMLSQRGFELPEWTFFRHFWTPDTDSEEMTQPFHFQMTPRASTFF